MNALRNKIIRILTITPLGWTPGCLIRGTHHVTVREDLDSTHACMCPASGNEVFTLLTLSEYNSCYFYSPISTYRHPWGPI